MRRIWIGMVFSAVSSSVLGGYEPGERSLLSAHNCYPYAGMWVERIDRALATGYPISIEQDLCWADHDGDGIPASIVAHNGPFDGGEPSLAEHFFERVRADVEASIVRAESDPGERDGWPMIVLDLDIKDDEPGHIEAIHRTLQRYQDWLTTAPRAASVSERRSLEVGPIMVLLTGTPDQRRVFHDDLEQGAPILAFGRRRASGPDTSGMSAEQKRHARVEFPPSEMIDTPADNFHRWWNNSWHVVEAGGANGAGDWTPAEAERLRALVEHAHEMGYFIRFYTINGHSKADGAVFGYSGGYNTGSIEAARVRWQAQLEAGVDLIATDQYRLFDECRDAMGE
ncbi:MAG: hypothetical protein JJ916_03470 [Phycisphaerales bacterium]|nr:hypothetical protein [Phycisphaerales bacterium]